jgi:hypothetical protein
MPLSRMFRVASVLCCVSFAAPALAVLSIDTLPLDAVRLRLTATQLVTPQPALKVDLPGRSLTFATKTMSPQSGMTGVRGATADAANRFQAFVWNGKILSADVYADDGRYQLVNHFGTQYWVRDVDIPTLETPLGSFDVNPLPPLPPAPGAPAPKAAPGPDGKYRIDLHVLYTPLYRQRTGYSVAAIQAEAQRLIFLSNTYFANSGMPIAYRLVGLSPYSATSEGVGCLDNLAVMAIDPTVRAARDATGADVAVLFRTSDNDSSGGMSQGFNQHVQDDPPRNVDPEHDGVVCVHAAPEASRADALSLDVEHSFAHELGHTLSGGHQYDRPKSSGGTYYWRPYGHAWQCGIAKEGAVPPFLGPGLYYDVMTGHNGMIGSIYLFHDSPPFPDVGVEGPYGPVIGQPKGDFFSNPRQKRGGMRCGADIVQPPLGEALQADNARAITEAAPYVAAYRATVVP